jgi:F1F0 ATPase subunit 2
MTTLDVGGLLRAAIAGAALGTFFFASLWWTVRRLATWEHAALLQVASLLLRMSVTLGGFFLAGAGDLPRLLACLGGFVVARVVVTRYVRARATLQVPLPEEERHAARP